MPKREFVEAGGSGGVRLMAAGLKSTENYRLPAGRVLLIAAGFNQLLP